MQVDQVYKERFKNEAARKQLWQILVRDFFQQYVRPNDVILDMPCGYGEFINAVHAKKKYALDINPDSKKRLNKNVTFLKSSSTKIRLPDKSVHKVFVSNFFEHLRHDDIDKTVKEIYRILKPGGQALILQPNVRFAYKNYWMFFDHITPIDDRALEEIFALNKLKPTKKILRFLPFTAQSKLPAKPFFVKLYLRLPIVWRLLGKQSFLIFTK